MCRSRQEIIDSEPTLQDLVLLINQQEEKLAKGENGEIHFELAQTRASLDTRIAQIQDREDIHAKLDDANTKRELIKRELKDQLEICETNIGGITTKLDVHIKDYVDHPSLRKTIAKSPWKTLTQLGSFIVATFVFLYVLVEAISVVTGFHTFFEAVISKFLGI